MDERLSKIVRFLNEKKGNDIVVIDVKETLPITSYFVICDFSNQVQTQAVANGLEKLFGSSYRHTEGIMKARWVLVDGGDIVIHIFMTEDRRQYNIEKMHRAEKFIDITELLAE